MKSRGRARLTIRSPAHGALPSARSAKPALFVAETAWKRENRSPSALHLGDPSQREDGRAGSLHGEHRQDDRLREGPDLAHRRPVQVLAEVQAVAQRQAHPERVQDHHGEGHEA